MRANHLRSGLILAALALAVTTSCGDSFAPDNQLVPGQTDFENTEPGNSYGRGDLESDGAKQGGGNYGTSPAPPSGSANKTPGAPSGRDGAVEEADIYRVDQDRMFYLNTYRGFLIYDLKNPKEPKFISRLPVYGYPIEMFVTKTTVYALIKDALYLTQVKGKMKFSRHNVSQLVAIDITDLSKPKVLKTVDITGQLREGVSRKIEDTIYVTSYINRYYYSGWGYSYNQQAAKEQAWVYAFNVLDPKNPKLVDKLKIFEGGGYSNSSKGGYESRYFDKVTIAATSNALMVVENWRKYGSVYNSGYKCGSYTRLQQAIVSIVDISDPSGKIKLHTKFETYGVLGDQFKQTYIYDKKTKTGTYFGIFARREWTSANCSGSSVIQNTLESWDVTNGAKPKLLHKVNFGKPNETVRGSVFDRERQVAFAITARRMDPLYAISFKDRKALKIMSEVDGLSGDMNVFRFINNNKFLIAIGRDNSSTCTGFGTPATGWATKVAVSIIDVQDLSKIRLVQRKCVAVDNASWVSSAVNNNLDQAHKMIGMHSDSKANVITVPVYYRKKTKSGPWWWYGYETAVGVMSWDLSKYNPTASHIDQKVLVNHGSVVHPKGQVRRTIVFTHKSGGDKRMMLNLSNTHISMVNIDDLNKPVSQSITEVAPYQSELFKFGKDYVVEHVPHGAYEPYSYGTSGMHVSEFRVKKLDGGALDTAKELSNFLVGQVQRVMKHKNNLLIFRRIPKEEVSKYGYVYWTSDMELVIFDMTNPSKPIQRGTLQLPYTYMPYYRYYCGPWGYWGGYWFDSYYYGNYGYGSTGWTATETGLTMLTYTYDSNARAYKRKLIGVDLTNTSLPKLSEVLLTNNKNWYFYGLISDQQDAKQFYLTYRVYQGYIKIGKATMNKYKYYAQRWSLKGSTWKPGPAINVPGRVVKTYQRNGSRLFLTYDFTYKAAPSSNSKYTSWTPSYRLNLLREVNYYGQPLAELLDFHNFKTLYLKDLVLDGSRMFVNAREASYYYGYYAGGSKASTSWDKYSDQLLVFDLSKLKLNKTYGAPTGTYNVRLMGTHKGRLFVNLPGDGILVVDATDPAKPVGQQFMRTLGYASHIEFYGNTVYVASGYFGIQQFNLMGPAAFPGI